MLGHFLRTVAADDDPNFRNVTLLLPGNGTNGAQNNTFIDSSTNNFTVTRNGNTTQGTFTPYGPNWSNYFAGSGNSLTVGANANLALGTGNFTVEAWVFLPSVTGTNVIASSRVLSNQNNLYWFFYVTNGQLGLQTRTGSTFYTATSSAGAIESGKWYHVAGVRNGGILKVFVNGVESATTANDGGLNLTEQYVGVGLFNYTSFTESYTGYISNFRIVKSAQYTGDFTPPSEPLTPIANTIFLTCQNNRLIDNSSNNLTITRNGSVSVQRFTPFNPNGPYESTVIGGSGYFDGNGDYLSFPENTAFDFGNGNFTVECWAYLTVSNDTQIIGQWGATSASSSWLFTPGYFAYTVGTSTYRTISYPSSAPLNQWVHIVACRQGTNLRIFFNGVLQTTFNAATDSIRIQPTNNYLIGFKQDTSSYWNGYMAELRVVKGVAVYTGAFTPPIAPLATSGASSASSYPSTTNIDTTFAASSTSLLLSYRNAGIIDNAMMNDLETVGNAQISTAQSRFGGGSISFDGAGDYLVSNPAITNLYAFGSNDFTIEFWLRLNATQTANIIDFRPSSTEGLYPTIYLSSNSLRYFTNTSDRITGATLSNSVWYHIALCRSGTSTRLFIDGTQTGSTYTDSNAYLCPVQRPFIGSSSFNVNTNIVNGYLDDLRITNGIARYTAAFTPPVRPFPTR